MKSFLVIVVNCMVITSIFIQCKSVKTEIKDQRYLGVDEGYKKERNAGTNQQDTMFLYCNDFRGNLDNKTKNIVAYNNGMIEYCLREKAFEGDSASVQQVAILISSMRHPFGTFNQKLRGEKIFTAVLERLNNFDIVPGLDGDMDTFTYYNLHGHILVDMIENIDGVSTTEYYRRFYHDKMKLYVEKVQQSGKEIDFVSREYIQTSSKTTWEIYKEAYEKRLINLKDFGKE